MVFNPDAMMTTLVIVLFFWVSVLSMVLFRIKAHYNKLTRGVTKHDLLSVLERVLEREKGLEAVCKDLEEKVRVLKQEGHFHLSRIGLVRFNPFSDTGGSQSFTLAMLDGQDNGLVMTSLYARTGNRWYVKEVRNGKSPELELSKEELSAIKRAQILR